MAGKVTVGLASHWPCVTDFSGLRKGDEHPASLLMGYGTLYPYLLELAKVTISCFFSAGPCISVDTTYYSGVIADYGALYCVLECVF